MNSHIKLALQNVVSYLIHLLCWQRKCLKCIYSFIYNRACKLSYAWDIFSIENENNVEFITTSFMRQITPKHGDSYMHIFHGFHLDKMTCI